MLSPDMTLVDFYILETNSQKNIWSFCCRLTEKVWRLGNTVHIRTNDEHETRLLDDMMWSYNKLSFLPHTIQGISQDAPVVIGHETSQTSADLLINLAIKAPVDIHQFTRVAEILNDDDNIKAAGRIRYSGYKQSGFNVNHHKIENKQANS